MRPSSQVLVADQAYLERFDAQPGFSFPVDDLPEPCLAPTLIVTGRQDALCGCRDAMDILEQFPRGTLVALDRAGHELAVEQQVRFEAMVNEWLDRVEEYARSASAGKRTHV